MWAGRMSQQEAEARARKRPKGVKPMQLRFCGCKQEKWEEGRRWKVVFQDKDGVWKMPQGSKLGAGCWEVYVVHQGGEMDTPCTSTDSHEYQDHPWYCHACYQRKDMCEFGRHKKAARLSLSQQDAAQSVLTRCDVRENLEQAEARLLATELVRIPVVCSKSSLDDNITSKHLLSVSQCAHRPCSNRARKLRRQGNYFAGWR